MAPKPEYSDSEDEWDVDAYFSRPYVPLSNLPTPPSSSHSDGSTRNNSFDTRFDDGDENLDPELLGPALHLTNLIPPTTSLTTPSTPLIQALLARAALPTSTLALAAIILDSLNSRFALCWRRALTPTLQSPKSKSTNSLPDPDIQSYDGQFDNESPPPSPASSSIDDLRPELLPLSALILAAKFLDDYEASSAFYAASWGQDLWSTQQINVAQHVVCENLQWRILPLCESNLIREAEAEMSRVGRMALEERSIASRSRMGIGMLKPTTTTTPVEEIVRKRKLLEQEVEIPVLREESRKCGVRVANTEVLVGFADSR